MSESGSGHTPDDGLMERTVNRELLKFACQRAIFDSITGAVLDMRRAVMISGRMANGTPVSSVMGADVWDTSEDILRAHIEDLTVLDGRELWPTKAKPAATLPKPHSLT